MPMPSFQLSVVPNLKTFVSFLNLSSVVLLVPSSVVPLSHDVVVRYDPSLPVRIQFQYDDVPFLLFVVLPIHVPVVVFVFRLPLIMVL